MPAKRQYIDHLGNEFESLAAMARYWGIPDSTLQARLTKMTIEQALTYSTEQIKAKNIGCTDHLGNKFPSKVAMCEHYGIDRQVYFGRIQIGWTVEAALTTPVDYQPPNSKCVTDHLGQEFASISDMCKFWCMTRSTYNARIKQGWSIERALTEPRKKVNMQRQKWTDHLGNDFPSLNKMCEAYGITHHTFSTRVNKLGWTVEKALTTPKVINSNECCDNMGHTFPSLADMCHYYGIAASKLQGKQLNEDQLHDCLISHFKKGTKIGNITIKKCIEFPYYLVKINHRDTIITFDQILDKFHNNDFYPFPKTKIQDKNLVIKKSIEFPYYEVEYKGETVIWDYWRIIQYRHDSNFGLSAQ